MQSYTYTKAIPDRAVDQLSSYPSILRMLLYNRGITNASMAERFLHPSYERDVHDPFLLTDMDRAVDRIEKAIDNEERITIYSDYDHDGIPGAVVFANYFDKIGFKNYDVYIPHRNTEGFGLNIPALDTLHKNGTQLIVTVDLGITGNGEVEHANRLGMETIITDHHTPGDLPKAYAIVNPKRDEAYPFRELCGSGVIWKVVQALSSRNENIEEGWEKSLLDLVSIATLADMVPITGENRTLVYEGLKQLRKTRRPGLLGLFRVTKLKQEQISEDDIIFMITPRINAVSRVDKPELALDLLRSSSVDIASEKAKLLQRANDERRGKMASMIKSAKGKLAKRDSLPDVIVIGNSDWELGLLGLIAQRISEDYGKNVFVWGKGNGETIKGSCRGNGKTDVVSLMKLLPEGILGDFGGHVHAGGFETDGAGCAVLESELNKVYEKHKNKISVKEEKEHIEANLELRDIAWGTYAHIEACAPFGLGNPKPIFKIIDATLYSVESFGKHGEHLKLGLTDEAGNKVEAISFFTSPGDFDKKLRLHEPITLLATLEKSNFRGFPELRLRIVDVL